MEKTKNFLKQLGLPVGDDYSLPASEKRFPDGAQYRIEIPSTEGPRALAAVLEEAEKRSVPVHRVSQGSGIWMLTDAEIREMVQIGSDAGVEVSLFVGPRAGWDYGAQVMAGAGKNLGARLRGMDQVIYATEDVLRAADLGIRSVLIADEGQLWLVNEMKKAGQLPEDFIFKISVQMGAANPISVRWIEQLGASTYNVPTDLSLPQLSAIRSIIDIPIDLYVEVPDNFGGFIRHYETPEIIRLLAPVYVKLGVRNAPDIYPSGIHIENSAVKLSRERVHRAELVYNLIQRYMPEATVSETGVRREGVPVL